VETEEDQAEEESKINIKDFQISIQRRGRRSEQTKFSGRRRNEKNTRQNENGSRRVNL
jgi:hypothetical protein